MDAVKIISDLDEKGLLFPGYKLNILGDKPEILGSGSTALVFGMKNEINPARDYAIKVIGLLDKTVSPKRFWETVNHQTMLARQSEFICDLIDAKALKIGINSDEAVEYATPCTENSADEEGLYLYLMLMCRMDPVVFRTKTGEIRLFADKLSSEEEVIKFALQIGQGIQAAHENNIFHRDIKLENIFWDVLEGHYRLGDFGVAKFVENKNAATIVFTDGYGAPEIENRLHESYDASADIYSFGVTLYLLLNNLRFPDSDSYIPNPVQYSKDYVFPTPEGTDLRLMRIVRKMCSYDPSNRFDSMKDVLIALEKVGFEEESEEDSFKNYLTSYETFATSPSEHSRIESPQKDDPWSKREYRKKIARQKALFEQSLVRTENTKITTSCAILCCLLLCGLYNFKILSGGVFFSASYYEFSYSVAFWILPVGLFFYGCMLQKNELRLLIGLALTALTVLNATTASFQITHILIILAVILGVPAVCSGVAAGIILWMPIAYFYLGENEGFNLVHELRLTWMIAIVLIIMLNNGFIKLHSLKMISERRLKAWWIWLKVAAWSSTLIGSIIVIKGNIQIGFYFYLIGLILLIYTYFVDYNCNMKGN